MTTPNMWTPAVSSCWTMMPYDAMSNIDTATLAYTSPARYACAMPPWNNPAALRELCATLAAPIVANEATAVPAPHAHEVLAPSLLGLTL